MKNIKAWLVDSSVSRWVQNGLIVLLVLVAGAFYTFAEPSQTIDVEAVQEETSDVTEAIVDMEAKLEKLASRQRSMIYDYDVVDARDDIDVLETYTINLLGFSGLDGYAEAREMYLENRQDDSINFMPDLSSLDAFWSSGEDEDGSGFELNGDVGNQYWLLVEEDGDRWQYAGVIRYALIQGEEKIYNALPSFAYAKAQITDDALDYYDIITVYEAPNRPIDIDDPDLDWSDETTEEDRARVPKYYEGERSEEQMEDEEDDWVV